LKDASPVKCRNESKATTQLKEPRERGLIVTKGGG